VPEGPVYQPPARRRVKTQEPNSKIGRAIWMTNVVIATLPALLAAAYVLVAALSKMISKILG
jgi:hypothetical protein